MPVGYSVVALEFKEPEDGLKVGVYRVILAGDREGLRQGRQQ